MSEYENKICPGCDNKTGQIMHVDELPCSDCGSLMVIEYLSCPDCNYSWREVNGTFLDGGRIDADMVDLLDDIVGFVEEHGIFNNNAPLVPHYSNMKEMIHHCMNCGEIAIQTSTKPERYECTVCNFMWEVDDIDG